MSFLFVINFKTYDEGTGEQALELAHMMDKVSKEKKKKVIAAVQPSDIYRISSTVSIPVYGQHIDAIAPGSHTGWNFHHLWSSRGP